MIPSFQEIAQPYAISLPESLDATTARPKSPILKTVASHSARDFLGQCLGRTAGLGIFTAVTHSPWGSLPAKILIGSVGALAAGTQAFLISKHQIGTTSPLQKTAVALCTVTAAVAGASIVALGSAQPVVALAVAAAATTAASLLKYCLFTQAEDSEATDTSKTIVFGITTAASLAMISVVTPNWISGESTFIYRSTGALIESSVVELCKSSFEQLGPSVNRSALTFNGKVATAMMGMVPYVAATAILNGYLSGRMQGNHDSHEFLDLWGPLLVGALSNAVRGASNAAAVLYLHQKSIEVGDPDAMPIRPSQGISCPEPNTAMQKTAIRFMLSCCRNALYFKFREHGMSVVQAGCLAQTCYAFYAQSRDLIFDLMQGEGWSEPVLITDLDPNQ